MDNPKEIIKDKDTGYEYASFDYYTGIAYAKSKQMKQVLNYHELVNQNNFLVCCGDVVIHVKENKFTDIVRRII